MTPLSDLDAANAERVELHATVEEQAAALAAQAQEIAGNVDLANDRFAKAVRSVDYRADIVERYGPERLLVNSAADWGPSKPTAVPDFIYEMRSRGHSEATIQRVVRDNPMEFFGRSRRFIPPERLK